MSVNLNNSSIFSLFTKNILGMDIQLKILIMQQIANFLKIYINKWDKRIR